MGSEHRRWHRARKLSGRRIAWMAGLGCALGWISSPAHAADFFWSATADSFDWFDRETPSGPPGFSPWQLLGGGFSGQAPDDTTDTATFALDKTTTYNAAITIDRATMNGGTLLMQGGTLTTVNGFTMSGPTAELAFTGGTLNTSAAALTNTGGTVRLISGFARLNADVVSTGDFVLGGGGTLSFSRSQGNLTQNAGSFSVASGTTANFIGTAYHFMLNGGTLDNDGTVTFSSTSVFDVGGGTINNDGSLTIGSSGTFTMDAGSLNTEGPTALTRINGGTFNHLGGRITGHAIELNGGNLNLGVPLTASDTSVGSPMFRFIESGSLSGNVHRAATVVVESDAGTTTVGTASGFENRGTIVLRGAAVSTGSAGLSFQSGGGLVNAGTLHAAFTAGGTQNRRLTGGSALIENTAAGELRVDPGVNLLLDTDLDHAGDLNIGTGASVVVGSGETIDMTGGTINNAGQLRFSGSGGPSTFRYAGGAITGNPLEFESGNLELAGGTSPATFHFVGGTNNQFVGDLAAGQTLVVDAETGNTTVNRGSDFNADNSFTNAGTLRLTGADANDTPRFTLVGNTSTLTNSGLIHAQGVPASSNLRRLFGSNGGQMINTGQITVDPDTTLLVAPAITNTGSVVIGPNAQFVTDVSGSASFTHNAGTINNQGVFTVGASDDFTYNAGTITGNPIELIDGRLTLASGTGSADFILNRGFLDGTINAGQTVELRNDTGNSVVVEAIPGYTNRGTLIMGGGGTAGNFLRIGPLFANLTLTNHGAFHTRNDNLTGSGGFRQLNGRLDNRGTAVIETTSEYRAQGTTNRASFSVEPGATVSAIGGQSFVQQAGTLNNQGLVFVNGGTFEFNGGSLNGNPVMLERGSLVLSAGVNGAGVFHLNDGGGFGGTVGPNTQVRFVAPATGISRYNLSGSPEPITNRGRIDFEDTADGNTQLIAGGSTLLNDAAGTITGSATLSFRLSGGTVRNRGLIAPGDDLADPAGLIEIFGIFEQESDGRLDLQIAGTDPEDFDRVTTNRTATLAGTLELSLAGGYVPTIGDSFEVLTAQTRTGTFDQVVGTPGSGLGWAVEYLADAVRVSIEAASFVVGDFTGNGSVEQADLDLILSNWGLDTTGNVPAGWVNTQGLSGAVDQAELDAVLSNWGSSLSPNLRGLAVPEPGVALWGLLAGCVGRRAGRRGPCLAHRRMGDGEAGIDR